MIESLRVLKVCRKTAVAARRVALQLIHNTFACLTNCASRCVPMTRMQLIRTLVAWRPDLSNYRQYPQRAQPAQGFRRHAWLQPCYLRGFGVREDSDAWLEGLREAFAYFGGVPEKALFDNAGAIILERDAYSDGLHRCIPSC